jgi:hypothetical protein
MLSCVSISLLNIERSRNIDVIENFQNPKNICSHVASLDMTKFQTCDSISQVGKIIAKIVEEVTNIHIEYRDEIVCYECGFSFTNLLTSMSMQLVVDLSTIPWFLVFYYICPNSPTFFKM